MILFACQCGSPYSVDDQYGGGTLECTACGKSLQIPVQSDPRVVLVYRAGESEDGVPMLREEVERLVAAGEFTETELIWDGTTWRPVTDVMGGGVSAESAAQHKLQLKRRDDESEESAEEDDPLGDIEPIQKVQLDEEELEQLPARKRGRKKARKEAKREGETGKVTGVRLLARRAFGSDPSLGPAVNIPIQLVWFLVIAYVGYRLGVGPLISKMRQLPCYVVVYNHGDTDCVASLGWRRLKKDVPPGASACFEVFVGMKERQKLTMTPKGGGQVLKVKVPMWPGGVTVVNPGGLGTFAQWRMSEASDGRLPELDVKHLIEQLTRHEAPSRIDRLVPEGRKIAARALVKARKDVLFTSKQYRFDWSVLNGSGGDSQTVAKFVERLNKQQEKSGKSYDLITCPPSRSVSFKGGSALYDEENENRVQMSIYLPARTFGIGKSQTIKLKADPKLDVTQRGGRLELLMEIRDYSAKFGDRTYKGTWKYEADKQKGKWTWRWSFGGSSPGAPKGRAQVSFRFDSSRKEHGPSYK